MVVTAGVLLAVGVWALVAMRHLFTFTDHGTGRTRGED